LRMWAYGSILAPMPRSTRKAKKKPMTTAEAARKRWKGVSMKDRKAFGKMLADARRRRREERERAR